MWFHKIKFFTVTPSGVFILYGTMVHIVYRFALEVTMTDFDVTRARLNTKDTFQRFEVGSSESLAKAEGKKVREKDEILILQRSGHQLAFSVFQMAYHHIAQGELAGEPYLVTF
jgi:hypothetical protein